MPQSVWHASAMCTIDGSDPATNYFGAFDLGFFYASGTKSFRRRVIVGFDLDAAPAEGRTLAPTDVVASATLMVYVTVLVGPAGWGAKAARLDRADWDDATATWNVYKTGSAWTAAGGDVATPPADVAFTSPAALGDFSIGGLEVHVADAIASRGGLLLLRLKPDVEADAHGVSTYISGADLGTSLAPRLTVTYASADPAPIARPHAHREIGARASASAPARRASAARSGDAAHPARPSRGGR
jgi:hypothetical protein